MDNAETVPRPVISFRLLGNVQKNGQLDNELLPYLNNTLGIIRLRCKPDGWKRIMSATSQRNEKHKDNPLCSCCGVIMDLYGRDFATKVRIDGVDYYCNNPQCCCDNRPRWHTPTAKSSGVLRSLSFLAEPLKAYQCCLCIHPCLYAIDRCQWCSRILVSQYWMSRLHRHGQRVHS